MHLARFIRETQVPHAYAMELAWYGLSRNLVILPAPETVGVMHTEGQSFEIYSGRGHHHTGFDEGVLEELLPFNWSSTLFHRGNGDRQPLPHREVSYRKAEQPSLGPQVKVMA